MLRAVLVALAVLALSVPAALTFVAADEPILPSVATSELVWSDQHFSDEALPGATGWFLVPVTVDRPAYVRFETDIFAGGNSHETAWTPLLVIEQGYQPPALGMGFSASASVLEVAHEGDATRCCEDMWTSYSYSWGEGPEVTIPLAPGQVAWFGMAATGWTEYDDVWFQTSGQTFITIGEPRTGERVEAVDLFEEALRAGTRVQLLGGDVVALPAPVAREWTSEGYGVFALDAWAWDDGAATLGIAIPGEPLVSTVVGMDTGAYAVAHRAGTYPRQPVGLRGADPGSRTAFADVPALAPGPRDLRGHRPARRRRVRACVAGRAGLIEVPAPGASRLAPTFKRADRVARIPCAA